MKVVFLDVDGVLNGDYMYQYTKNRPCCDGYLGIGLKHLRLLASIVDADTKIVLVSSWKYDYEDYIKTRQNKIGRYLYNKLERVGLRVYETTTKYEDAHYCRGAGICKYLNLHPEVSSYVILDDETYLEYNKELKEHFVHTDFILGLTDADVLKARKILRGELDD